MITAFVIFKNSAASRAYTLCWSHCVGVNCVSGCVLAAVGRGREGAGEQAVSTKSKLRTHRGFSQKVAVAGLLEDLTLSSKIARKNPAI